MAFYSLKQTNHMKKQEVILFARELFKIRIMSAREGYSQDDGMHKLSVKNITAYNQEAIEKWYQEALKTAEIIISLEDEYLNRQHNE